MARYNKIYAGPGSEPSPHVREAVAAAAVMPGSMVTLNGDRQFALAAANTTGEVFVAQENYLAMKGVENEVPAGEIVIGMELLSRQHFRALVATGNNVVEGDALALGANGTLVKAGAASRVVGHALESFNNDTGSAQLVTFKPAAGFVSAA